MASIIISLLVQLLVAFLKEILSKWLSPSAPEQKAVFMTRVDCRWWLGRKRKDYAEKLWAKMSERNEKMPMSSSTVDERVSWLTDGLTLEQSER